MTERPLGRDTWVTVRHWDRLVASLPIAPHVMRGVVPTASPNVRRFHHRTFLDQRQRGFCVGANTCATIMTLLRIPPGATADSQPLPTVRLSFLYVYDISWVEAAAEGINLGRNPGPGGDGSIASCAMKGCHIHGVVLASDYPCGPQDIDNHRNGTVPPSSVEAVGREHLVEEFAIADSWDHGLELLGAGFPISLASDIPSGMMQTDAQGRFRMRGGIVGGHDYQFIDYDKSSDTAWIGQSWKGWGEHTTDPAYAEMFGVTMIGTCSLADLASYFTPRLMSSGASEICVANRVKGWGPPIIHYDL
jgi:hypothetical protein